MSTGMVPARRGSSTWQKKRSREQAVSLLSTVIAGRLRDPEVSGELLWLLPSLGQPGQSAEGPGVLSCGEIGLVVAVLLSDRGRAHHGCAQWQCGTYTGRGLAGPPETGGLIPLARAGAAGEAKGNIQPSLGFLLCLFEEKHDLQYY